jgi:hypothetical protein
LVAFANEFVDDAADDIRREAIEGRIGSALDKIEDSTRFGSLVKIGVASTLIASAFLALLAFGAQYFGIDLVDAIGSSPEAQP